MRVPTVNTGGRLRVELLADEHNIDNTLVFWNKVSDYGEAAIANGETGLLVGGSNWKTLLAWYQAGQLMTFELEDATYTEMRDGGGLVLIYQEGLRKQLAERVRSHRSGSNVQSGRDLLASLCNRSF
jgi:hypothetical protein